MDDTLHIKDLNEVWQECKSCSASWDMIALNLGVVSTSIAIIKRDNPSSCEDCMCAMLAKWLKRENEKSVPNWKSLCQALSNVDISYKPTADRIAKKYNVSDYNKKKELYDKEKAVTGAKNLKNEFKKLLKVAYHVVSAADVGLFTLCVNWFFNSERQTTPQIQQHLTELDKMPTSLGILNYLVRNNFIGYLNYNLLKEFKGLVTESTDWSQNIDLYERKHDEFIHSVSFNTLIEVFQQYPNLALFRILVFLSLRFIFKNLGTTNVSTSGQSSLKCTRIGLLACWSLVYRKNALSSLMPFSPFLFHLS